MPLQVFPCFVCTRTFCVHHIFTHSCARFASSQDIALSGLHIRPKINLLQYSRPKGLDSTILLELLTPRASLSKWSGDNSHISGAHHIFPKAALVWVYEHMSERQQKYLKKLLMLPKNAGGLALTRLRSNLISAHDGTDVVRPEERRDDPHHHGGSGLVGEEYLDLVRTVSGALESRSRCYQQAAWFVSQIITPRFLDGGRSTAFELSDGEATVVISLILKAEVIHYYVEQDPTMPSFSTKGFWKKDDHYSKGRALDIKLPDYIGREDKSLTLYENFVEEKKEEKAVNDQKARRRGQDDAPRLRTFKSERLGGFERTTGPQGSRRWLLDQFVTQLETDVASQIDIQASNVGHGYWEKEAVAFIKSVARELAPDYERCRENAYRSYASNPHGAHELLPRIRVHISEKVIYLFVVDSYGPEEPQHHTGQQVVFDSRFLRRLRRK